MVDSTPNFPLKTKTSLSGTSAFRRTMRNKRVVIYGGTDLDPLLAQYVTGLAQEFLKTNQILLATGGFKRHLKQEPDTQPTDVAVLSGAQAFAFERKVPLESIFETWLPESAKDRREEGGIERFREGRVRDLHGLSDQARRLRLVQVADCLITVKGKVSHSAGAGDGSRDRASSVAPSVYRR